MTLTQEQANEVKEWLQGGAGIGDVQKRLSEKFGINMTYMDVRFLIDDLNLEVIDKPEPKKEVQNQDVAAQEQPSGQIGGVKLELSPVMRPGMIAAGSVTFSDGVHSSWELDQNGRLRLDGAPADYRPSESDLMDFQSKLKEALGGGM